MPVLVKGLGQFVKHCGNVQTEANKVSTVVVTKIARRAKEIELAAAGGDFPGRRLSRANNGAGVNLQVQYKVAPGGAIRPASAIVMPSGNQSVGLWYLAEGGGSAHDIGKRVKQPGKRGLRGQPGFLGRPGVFAAMGPVHHPKIEGKHTWDKGAATAIAGATAAFASEYRHAWFKVYAG